MPRRALTLGLLLLSAAAPAFAQGQKDRVLFRDRATGKEETADGDVVDSPSGVRVTNAGKDRTISAADIVRVDYAALDPAPGRVASLQAESRGGADALKFYTDAAKTIQTSPAEKAKRTVAFRDAYWTGVVAAGKDDKDFPAEAKKAADKMVAFMKAYPKGWEQWQVARAAARLYGELEDWAAADGVLKELGTVADAAPELKQDAKLARVGYMIRAGKPTDASTALAEVEAENTAGAVKDRAVMYRAALNALPAPAAADAAAVTAAKPKLAAAVAAIEKAIAASKDPAARGVGYGVLGELQLAHGQLRAATWSFCWVDTVYTQDADERLFAVVRLAKIFAASGDKDGDKSRADQYRDRLSKVR